MILSFAACNDVELTSCDLKVYHTSDRDKGILDELSNEIYFSKGWSIEPIKINKHSEVDRSEQHAVFSRDVNIYRHNSITVNPYGWDSRFDETKYNYKINCLSKLSFNFPEIRKKDDVKYKKSYVTDYSPSFNSHEEFTHYAYDKCETSVLKLISKVPNCKQK